MINTCDNKCMRLNKFDLILKYYSIVPNKKFGIGCFLSQRFFPHLISQRLLCRFKKCNGFLAVVLSF